MGIMDKMKGKAAAKPEAAAAKPGKPIQTIKSSPVIDSPAVPAAKKEEKKVTASVKTDKALGAGCTVKFLPGDHGTIKNFYHKSELPAGDGNILHYTEVAESKVPAHRYTGKGEEKIGDKMGSDSSRFYKLIGTTFAEARRQKMAVHMINPNGAPLGLQIVLNLNDDSLLHLKKKGDVISAEQLQKARGVACCNPAMPDFDVSKMAAQLFARPETANCVVHIFK